MKNTLKFLIRDDGATIAYHQSSGCTPGVIFLGGFMSGMDGTKAVALEAHCKREGRAYLRFDYQGHGQSSGNFTDGDISRWSGDAIDVLDKLTTGPQLLVGSSMGGWVMLLAALARPERITGLVGIAAAPDFTETLMWGGFSSEIQETLLHNRVYYAPSEHSEQPYAITMNLIENGRENLLLNKSIDFHGPVHLFQGMMDESVPWKHALTIARKLTSNDVTTTLIKDGDHRLSREKDLEKIFTAINRMAVI